jgi:hypothetical protein
MSCSETRPSRVKAAGTTSPASATRRRAQAKASRLSWPDSTSDVSSQIKSTSSGAQEATVVIRDTPVSAGYILLRKNSPRVAAAENQKRTQRPARLPLPPKVKPIAVTKITRTSKPLAIHQMPNFSVDHVSAEADQSGRERRLLAAITIWSAQAIAAKSPSTILIAVLSSSIALSPRFCYWLG